MVDVDAVGQPARRHVLRPLPAEVVCVSITHLQRNHKNILLSYARHLALIRGYNSQCSCAVATRLVMQREHVFHVSKEKTQQAFSLPTEVKEDKKRPLFLQGRAESMETYKAAS